MLCGQEATHLICDALFLLSQLGKIIVDSCITAQAEELLGPRLRELCPILLDEQLPLLGRQRLMGLVPGPTSFDLAYLRQIEVGLQYS